MSGRAYTMQEMRDIVTFLVDNHAYSEIKARSMWINFAKSGKTNRTWQSLKETFLKRILPDIHNPYYKLTENQILSFRRKTDLTKKSINKLELQEVPVEKSNDTEAGPSRSVVPDSNTGENENRKELSNSVVNDAIESSASEDVVKEGREETHTPDTPTKSLKERVAAALNSVMSVMADWDSEGSDSSRKKEKQTEFNTENTVSTTTSVTQDTLLPENREVNEHSETIEDNVMTRSKLNQLSQDGGKKQKLKPALKKIKKKSPVSPKKNVRLSDIVSTIEENGYIENHAKENEKSTDSGEISQIKQFLSSEKTKINEDVPIKNVNVKQRKGRKTRSQNPLVDVQNSVEELLAVLTDSNLPNNQEEIKGLRKIHRRKTESFNENSVESVPKSANTQEHQSPVKITEPSDKDHSKTPNLTKSQSASPRKSERINGLDSSSDVSRQRNEKTPSPLKPKHNLSPKSAEQTPTKRSNKEKPATQTTSDTETHSYKTRSSVNTNEVNTVSLVETSSNEEDHKSKEISTEDKAKNSEVQQLGSKDSTPDLNSNNGEVRLDDNEIEKSKTTNDISDPSANHKENPVNSSNNEDYVTASTKTNPCLLSASLFEEKPLNDHSDSQIPPGQEKSSNVNSPRRQTGRSPLKLIKSPLSKPKDDILLLKSHSSDSGDSTEPIPIRKRLLSAEAACSKLFGNTYASHGYRKRRRSENLGGRKNIREVSSSSESSDYESSGPDDYIPVPRPGRKHRRMSRPIGGRVSMLSDGALVAVCRGKVYSLVAQKGSKVYTLKYTCRAQKSEETDVIRLSSNSPVLQSAADKNKVTAGQRRPDAALPSESTAAVPARTEAVPPPEQTCLTLTKDRITLAGDMEQIMSALPRLREVFQDLKRGADEKGEGSREISEESDEVRARVEAREAEIFKEIAERDREEQRGDALQPTETKGRSRRKRPLERDAVKRGSSSESEKEIILQEETTKKRKGRPPKQAKKEPTDAALDDSGESLYALPPEPTRPAKIGSFELSLESSLGYRDTDESVIILKPRVHRKLTYPTAQRRRSISLARERQHMSHDRRRSIPRKRKIFAKRCTSSDDETDIGKHTKRNETAVDIEITPCLTPIRESVASSETNEENDEGVKIQMNTSSVTLPPSPEISIVENITIPASSISINTTINKELGEHTDVRPRHVSIALENVNMSCPLMEQDLEITSSKTSLRKVERSSSSFEEMEICVTNCEDVCMDKANPTVTDSLISRVTSVKINDSNDSIPSVKEFNTQFLSTIRLSPKDRLKVHSLGKGQSRSSTPNKKAKVRKSHPLTVIEEDFHIESCARIRPKSCPGAVDIEPHYYTDKATIPMPSIAETRKSETKLNKWKIRTPMKRKPKIIKVKIGKPKRSSIDEEKAPNKRSTTGFSILDEGDASPNATAQSSSSELIHNHSESCLAGVDCLLEESRDNVSDSGVALRMQTLTPHPDCFDCDAQDGASELPVNRLEASNNEELRLSSLGSLLTEDVSLSPAASWSLSEDEEERQSYGDEARWSYENEERELIEKYGRDVVSLFPLCCAVPHLSTITEASCDTRESSNTPQ